MSLCLIFIVKKRYNSCRKKWTSHHYICHTTFFSTLTLISTNLNHISSLTKYQITFTGLIIIFLIFFVIFYCSFHIISHIKNYFRQQHTVPNNIIGPNHLYNANVLGSLQQKFIFMKVVMEHVDYSMCELKHIHTLHYIEKQSITQHLIYVHARKTRDGEKN